MHYFIHSWNIEHILPVSIDQCCQCHIVKFTWKQQWQIIRNGHEAKSLKTSRFWAKHQTLHRKKLLDKSSLYIFIDLGRWNKANNAHMLSRDRAGTTCLFVMWLKITYMYMQIKYSFFIQSSFYLSTCLLWYYLGQLWITWDQKLKSKENHGNTLHLEFCHCKLWSEWLCQWYLGQVWIWATWGQKLGH